MVQISDDAFLAFAQAQEEEANKPRNAGFGTKEYEEIKWTGLEKGRMKVIRAVGGVPDAKTDPFTARTVRIARIIGDNGKQFRCVFPDRPEDENHILWRIMARVNAIEWVNGKKVYTNEIKYPEIFNIVNKNGLKKDHKQFKFEKGWQGRHVVLINVIDREQMDWHREHKHTMLLSRNVSVSPDGHVFAEEGIPSYGFLQPTSLLFKYYKSWERYDIGIIKTGQMQAPYHIVNAGVNIAEVPEDIQPLVKREVLTEEEASWERYDLNKIFGYTTSTKIYNRLKGAIARIDAVLGTNFLKELKEQADMEQTKWELENNKPAAADESTDVDEVDVMGAFNGEDAEETAAPPVQQTTTTRKVASRSITTPAKGFNTELLVGWSKLTDTEKDAIEDTVVKNGKVVDIVYKDKNAVVYACPDCKVPAPDSFTTCPNCGLSF